MFHRHLNHLAAAVLAAALFAEPALAIPLPVAPSQETADAAFHWTLTRSSLGFENMRIPNPAGFRGKPLARVTKASIHFDLKALMAWTIRLKHVRVELEELTIVRNEAGETNIDLFLKFPLPKIHVDHLDVKINNLILVDQSAGPARKETRVRIDFHERFRNVTAFSTLTDRVWLETMGDLKRAAVARTMFFPLRAVAWAAATVLSLGT